MVHSENLLLGLFEIPYGKSKCSFGTIIALYKNIVSFRPS